MKKGGVGAGAKIKYFFSPQHCISEQLINFLRHKKYRGMINKVKQIGTVDISDQSVNLLSDA